MRVTIRTKLLGLGLGGLAFTLGLGAGAQVLIDKVVAAMHRIHVSGEALRNHMEADMMHDALRGDVLASLLADAPEERAEASRSVAEHGRHLREMVEANERLGLDAPVRAALDAVHAPLDAYLASAETLVERGATNRAAAKAFLPEFLQRFAELETKLGVASDLIGSDQKAADESGTRSASDASQAMVVVCGIAALGLMVGAGLVARSITGPLRRVVARMQEIADGDGDLTQRLSAESNDEVSDLVQRFNRFMDAMHGVLVDIRSTAGRVAVAALEVSSRTEHIARGAHEQAASLEETAASLEEMTSTIQHNAENAGHAAQLAATTRAVASEGGAVVANAVRAMAEIDGATRRIADILSAIDEIAFQTNLLALNAAVEAARAGDHGRGFAVVAAEVRELAQRSAGAAKETKALIQLCTGKVAAGGELVGESGRRLTEIVDSVKRVTDIVGEIATASSEQAAGVEQLNGAVTQIDHVTQESAAATAELSGTADGLSEQAHQLERLMARFKLGATAAALPAAPPLEPGRGPRAPRRANAAASVIEARRAHDGPLDEWSIPASVPRDAAFVDG